MMRSLLIALVAPALSAQTLQNGSFEDINFGSTAVFPTSDAAASALISPWTTTNAASNMGMMTNLQAGTGNTTFGTQFIGTKGSGAIAQSLGYGAGNYEITFSVGDYDSNDGGASSDLVALNFTGTSLSLGTIYQAPGGVHVGWNAGANQNIDFNTYTVPFTVTSPTQTLTFRTANAVIDNITISPVPEPSASLLAALVGGCLLLRRRKTVR